MRSELKVSGTTDPNFISTQRVTSPVEVETDGLMIGGIGVEIDLDRTNSSGDVHRDKQEVAAMGPAGPLITVKDPTGWIVGNVAVKRRPRVVERRRIVLAREQKLIVMPVAGNEIEVAAQL